MKEGHYHHIPITSDWHIVEITKKPNGNFEWKNKANAKWTLIPIVNQCNTLEVGKDCPYYNNGHTTATFDENGIYGPWNAFYSYQGKITSQT